MPSAIQGLRGLLRLTCKAATWHSLERDSTKCPREVIVVCGRRSECSILFTEVRNRINFLSAEALQHTTRISQPWYRA